MNQLRRTHDGVRICCLPVAGMENPYQHLMMQGLRRGGRLDVRHGSPGKFLVALRTVLKQRPDAIHYDWIHRYFLRRNRIWTHIHAPIFILELILVRYVFGCRIVWTMHNLLAHDAKSDRIEIWTRRTVARLCDWIRVFDASTIERASRLLQVPQDLFRVMPEGSYVDYYPNSMSRDEARELLHVEPDKFVMLYVGQVRPYKGIEDLLDAFEAVRSSSWVLIVAGLPVDKQYADEISKRAENIDGVRMHLTYVDDDQLQIFLNAASVVILPYKKVENSGAAILAMGFGRPIIAPRIGALARRLAQQNELLYEPGELNSALEMLKTWTAERLDEIGERNRHAAQLHAWDDFAHLFDPETPPRRHSSEVPSGSQDGHEYAPAGP